MPSITSTYAAAYARSGAGTQPCDIRFTALDAQGAARPLELAELARLFSDSNGLAPTAGIVDLHGDRPARDFATALCLRNLLPSLTEGLREIQMSADTGRRPVIVLHGRDDGLIAVNHTSRAWYALRQQRPFAQAVRYYEIEHVQHFDAFVPLPQMRGNYLPMQPFLNAALDLMWRRLTTAERLPPSQLWRTRPGSEPLDTAQLGALRRNPGPDHIRVASRTLLIPD
jgi:hydroxybutyrate-dimer hydrolase